MFGGSKQYDLRIVAQAEHPRNGFTLIELLVVIAVLSILLAILTPVTQRALEYAKEVTCRSNLRQIGMGSVSYGTDEGILPASYEYRNQPYVIAVWPALVRTYGGVSENTFYCPIAPEAARWTPSFGSGMPASHGYAADEIRLRAGGSGSAPFSYGHNNGGTRDSSRPQLGMGDPWSTVAGIISSTRTSPARSRRCATAAVPSLCSATCTSSTSFPAPTSTTATPARTIPSSGAVGTWTTSHIDDGVCSDKNGGKNRGMNRGMGGKGFNRRHLLLLLLGVVIGICWWSTFRSFKGDGDSPAVTDDQSWFWDPVEQREFAAPSLSNPPVESPWGNPSPMVLFFSCADCDERFPGIYISLTPEMKAQLASEPDGGGAALGPSHAGRLYSVDAVNWIEAESMEEANAQAGLSTELAKRCPGSLRMCR